MGAGAKGDPGKDATADPVLLARIDVLEKKAKSNADASTLEEINKDIELLKSGKAELATLNELTTKVNGIQTVDTTTLKADIEALKTGKVDVNGKTITDLQAKVNKMTDLVTKDFLTTTLTTYAKTADLPNLTTYAKTADINRDYTKTVNLPDLSGYATKTLSMWCGDGQQCKVPSNTIKLLIPNNAEIHLGHGIAGKDPSAGGIGYSTRGHVYITGGGTTNGNRRVEINDDLIVKNNFAARNISLNGQNLLELLEKKMDVDGTAINDIKTRLSNLENNKVNPAAPVTASTKAPVTAPTTAPTKAQVTAPTAAAAPVITFDKLASAVTTQNNEFIM